MATRNGSDFDSDDEFFGFDAIALPSTATHSEEDISDIDVSSVDLSSSDDGSDSDVGGSGDCGGGVEAVWSEVLCNKNISDLIGPRPGATVVLPADSNELAFFKLFFNDHTIELSK